MFSKIITRSDITSVEQLRKIVGDVALELKGYPIYVMMSAAINPATGKPWCPDCVAAIDTLIPKIERAPEQHKSAVIIVPIERDVYKSQDPVHPFKADSELQLTAIPTIYRYNSNSGRLEKGLVEAEVYDPVKFDKYFNFDF